MPAAGSPSATRSLQGQVAAARRWGRDSRDLERDYAAERLADYIKSTVDAAPPLTPAQRHRLAVLLSGASDVVAS